MANAPATIIPTAKTPLANRPVVSGLAHVIVHLLIMYGSLAGFWT
jgi:hypothetical protein